MKNAKLVLIALMFLLCADLVFSFFQYINQGLDGDLASIALPGGHYQEVLNDPFGLKVVSGAKRYSGAGRFFAHWFSERYTFLSTRLFSVVSNPLDSVYLGLGSLKFVMHLLIVVFVARSAKLDLKKIPELLLVLLSSALVIAGKFEGAFTTVMAPPIYAIFYTLPLVVLLLFYLRPLVNSYLEDKPLVISVPQCFIGLIAILPLCQMSPTVPPLILISLLAYGLTEWLCGTNPFLLLKKMDKKLLALLVCLGLGALYSYYVGTFNTENDNSSAILLPQRFRLMLVGLVKYFGTLVVIPLVLLSLLSRVLTRKQPYQGRRKLELFVLITIVLFTLLLPFGGYREYRPYIIRGDTYMIVSLLLMLCTVLNFKQLFSKYNSHIPKYVVFGFVIYLYAIDLTGIGRNHCEKRVIREANVLTVDGTYLCDYQCSVLSWGKMQSDYHADINAKFLQKLGVSDEYIKIKHK